MKLKPLGRTDLSVTELCLGTMTWGVQNSEADAHAQLDYALDAGINFIDTAEGYAIPMSAESYGKTEAYIGTWLKRTGNRDKIVLASKIAGGGSKPWIRNSTMPDQHTIRAAVEESLKRLQTDYIDLYQIHWPARSHFHFGAGWSYDPFAQDADRDTKMIVAQMHEVLEALGELVKQGKIRHVGLSNETSWGSLQWLKLSEQYGLPRVVSVQNEYSLLQRHFDHDLAEMASHEQVGLMAYSPLAAGVLTGKYLDGAMPAGSRGTVANDGFWRNQNHADAAVRSYRDCAIKHGLDLPQMALAFALSRPFMTSVIIGATTLKQLETNIGASELSLTPDVLVDIASIYRHHPKPL